MPYDYEFQKILNESRHYFDMGHYEQALAKLDQLLSASPNDDYILYLRAKCLFCLARYDEAIKYCNEALAGGFLAYECNYLLGLIFIEENRCVQAEECLLEALREQPQMADIMATYGYLMLKTGHDKKAVKLIEEALRMEPSNEVALQFKFYYQLAKNKRDDQVETLERYLRASDSEVRKLAQVGMMEAGRGNYKAARDNFKQAFLLDPTDRSVLSILQDTEKLSSILYLPHRIIGKIGGPAVVWGGMIVTLLILRGLGLLKAAGVIAVIYAVFCIYTWVMPILYRAIKKRD